jgi:hypothetical protein
MAVATEIKHVHKWDIDAHHHGVCECGAEFDFSPIADPRGRDRLKPEDYAVIKATKRERFLATLRGREEAKEALKVQTQQVGTGEENLIKNHEIPENLMTPKEPDRKKDFNGWLDYNEQAIRADYSDKDRLSFMETWKINGVMMKALMEHFSLPKRKDVAKEHRKYTRRRKITDSQKPDTPSTPGNPENINVSRKILEQNMAKLDEITTRLVEINKLLDERLSKLPPFNEAWQPEVKIKWLDVFEKLALAGKGEN